jgi:hypothetical protein
MEINGIARSCILIVAGAAASCGARQAPSERAGAIAIDRFSARAGHLMVRDASNHLPGPDDPIDFDQPPFLTHGLGPDGVRVHYYNLDVQPDRPARLFRFVTPGTTEPVAGQPDVVDALPGDPGYSDFWQVGLVPMPAGAAPGSITSLDEIRARGLVATPTPQVIDCAIVPRGSTAREGDPVRVELAYRGRLVECLRFGAPLALAGDVVPTSPIYVTFAREHVFRTEPGAAAQTHNVVLSVPGDVDYSPLWAVHIYDPAAFDRVHDEASALAAPLAKQGPHVNCPVVWVEAR